MAPRTPRPERVPGYIAGLTLIGWPLSYWLAVGDGTTPGWKAGVLTVTVLLSAGVTRTA